MRRKLQEQKEDWRVKDEIGDQGTWVCTRARAGDADGKSQGRDSGGGW